MFGPAILVSPVLQPDADAEKNNTIPPNQRINNDDNSRWDLIISSRQTDPNTRRTVTVSKLKAYGNNRADNTFIPGG